MCTFHEKHCEMLQLTLTKFDFFGQRFTEIFPKEFTVRFWLTQ